MDTRNEDRHVPLAAYNSEKSWWLKNQHLIKRSPVPQKTQEGELWRKVAEDLSTWQGGIYPFKENDKRWRNPKGGSEKVHLEVLGREDWKSALRTPPPPKIKRKVNWGFFGGKSQKKNVVKKRKGSAISTKKGDQAISKIHSAIRN